MADAITRHTPRPDGLQQHIENIMRDYDSKGMWELADEDDSYLQDLKNGFWGGYDVAPEKRFFLESEISRIEQLFNTDINKIAGIVDHPDTYELTVWAYQKFRVQPSCKMLAARNILWENDILTRFSVSSMTCNYLEELPHPDAHWYDNKQIIQLTLDELWLEAVQYLVYGVHYAHFSGYLKELLTEYITKGTVSKEAEQNILFPVEGLPAKILLCDRLGILKAIAECTGLAINSTKFAILMAELLGSKWSTVDKYFRIAQYDFTGNAPNIKQKNNHRMPAHYETIIKFLDHDLKLPDEEIVNRIADELELLNNKYNKE